MKFKALIVSLVFFFLVGCGALQTVEESPVTARYVVQKATEEVIDNDQQRADRVFEIVQNVREYIELEDEVRARHVVDYIDDQIKWDNLSTADQYLVAELLVNVEARLINKFDDDRLSENDIIQINQVLDWIERIAVQ